MIFRTIFVIGASLFSFCVRAEEARDNFVNSYDHKKVEYFWSKPSGQGPFPLLFFIHPDQDSPKNGGQVFVENGQFDFWVNKGFAVAAISQPGFGKSEGSADFCGPKTQQAVIDLLKLIKTKSYVDSKHIYLYGGSRGAVVAAMVSTRESTLAGVILKSGVYDFNEWSLQRSWYDPIKLSMLWEIGWLTQSKLNERSAILFAKEIRVPLLVIHGTNDNRAPIKLAQDFVDTVQKFGGNAKIVKIEFEHVIPMNQITELMDNFVKEHNFKP